MSIEKIVVVLRYACKDVEEEYLKSYCVQFPTSDSASSKIETPSILFITEAPLGYQELETCNVFQQGSSGLLNPLELFPLKLLPTKFPVKFWISVIDLLKHSNSNVRSEFKELLKFIHGNGKTHVLCFFKVI